MNKRSCIRFSIRGTTLYYKKAPRFFLKPSFSHIYYPVIDFSRGGARFLCNERLKAGVAIIIKLNIPGTDFAPELSASVRWISRNPEQSYRYQTGIAFNSYGKKKNENSFEILSFLEKLETDTIDTDISGTSADRQKTSE